MKINNKNHRKVTSTYLVMSPNIPQPGYNLVVTSMAIEDLHIEVIEPCHILNSASKLKLRQMEHPNGV